MRLWFVLAMLACVIGGARAHTVFHGNVSVVDPATTGPDSCATESPHACASGLSNPIAPHPWHGPVTIDFGTGSYTYHGNVAVVPHHVRGEACSDAGQCLRSCAAGCGSGTCNPVTGYCDDMIAGYCVEGVCCDGACDGGCGTCNAAGSVGTCVPKAKDAICRPLAGACDIAAETCPGPNPSDASVDPRACPADHFYGASGQPAKTCRAASGVCDVAEQCNGQYAACPPDTFADPGTTCRPAVGVCDKAEVCTGVGTTCPADGFDVGKVCRPSAGGCDPVEVCGAAADCPSDQLTAAGTVCRAAAGTCDVDDRCTGSSAACTDNVVPAGTACGPSASCTGASAGCPGTPFGTCDPTPSPSPPPPSPTPVTE